MNNLGRTATIILATLLVAVTPVVALADVGTKTERNAQESALLSKINALLGGPAYDGMSHGEIVSSAASMDLQALISMLELDPSTPTEKLTRGQIIRVFAHEAPKGNSVEVEDATANNDTSDNDTGDKEKKDKDKKVVGQARADANRDAAAAAAAAREDSEDDEETVQGRSGENRQGANSHSNATRTTDGVTASVDEPGSQGQGRGNGNQNR